MHVYTFVCIINNLKEIWKTDQEISFDMTKGNRNCWLED